MKDETARHGRMKIMLIQPPLEDFYTTPIRFYPLGLLYAARVLLAMGVEVEVLDCLTPLKKRQLPLPADFAYLRPFMHKEPLIFQHYYRFGRPMADILAHIKTAAPDSVGIAAQFTAYHKSVADLAAAIKSELGLPIFVGGNHATVMAARIAARTPAINDILMGPAEKCLPPYLARINPRLNPEPFDWKQLTPAHELLAADAYRIGRRNYISLTASRGCPQGCDFCSVKAMFGTRMQYRAVADVLDEMRINYRQKKVRLFNFEDDNIAADKKWFRRLLTAVAADETLKEVELTAMNGITYAHLDPPLLALIAEAGFKRLNLSYVTHNRRLRRTYHRPGGDDHHLESLVSVAQKVGLMVTVYVIIGLPGQTYAEIKDSIDYLLGLGVLVGPSVFYIPPGSALYDRLELKSEILDNWNLYRSAAFAVESEHLSRAQLVELFAYTRRRNLENKST